MKYHRELKMTRELKDYLTLATVALFCCSAAYICLETGIALTSFALAVWGAK